MSNRPSALLDEGGDLITRHDSSGNVGAASEIARELLGIEPDQLHGRGLARRVHIEDRTRFDQALHDAATGDVTVRVAYRMTRATSGLATHEWFESSFRRASGDADDIQIVGVTRATSDPDGARRVAPGSPLTPNRSDDVERALDAVVRFSQLLSNPQITPRQDEWQSYGRLLRVAGAQLSESVGVNVSNATLAAPDTNNPKTSLLSVVREAAADASVRGGPVVVADAVDEAALDTPAAECTHVVANILRALRHRMPVDGSWIISTQHGDRTARLTFRVAMPKLPVKPLGAYTGLASVLELGLSESAAIVAKWGGELSIGKPDPTGPEVVLELPLAHPDRGGDDLEDERWSEVRKSA